ncbi:general odorant-binding protein 72 [Anabrus simplex]|uniref:general odorant-binding protein 72 n=1 Tax=Anabrus simplex TaxID=316456 RepID=UPI0035A32EE8
MNFMFLGAAVCLMAAGSLAMTMDQLRNLAKMPRSMCIQKTGVNKDLVDKIQVGEFPEDPKLKCYMKCAMGMMQLLKNGKYSPEAAISQTDKMMPDELKERFKVVIEKCKEKATGADVCEDAFQIVRCNYEQDKEAFFFP